MIQHHDLTEQQTWRSRLGFSRGHCRATCRASSASPTMTAPRPPAFIDVEIPQTARVASSRESTSIVIFEYHHVHACQWLCASGARDGSDSGDVGKPWYLCHPRSSFLLPPPCVALCCERVCTRRTLSIPSLSFPDIRIPICVLPSWQHSVDPITESRQE